jgi:hypothetical protein
MSAPHGSPTTANDTVGVGVPETVTFDYRVLVAPGLRGARWRGCGVRVVSLHAGYATDGVRRLHAEVRALWQVARSAVACVTVYKTAALPTELHRRGLEHGSRTGP